MRSFLKTVGVLTAFVLIGSSGAHAQKQAVKVDLFISNATIITMDSDRRIIENGEIVIRGDSILALGPAPLYPKGVSAKQKIDARGKLLLPGFINGHTHAPMTLLRGLKDDVTLDVWLKDFIFPAEARNVTEDFSRWGTRLAAAEMIKSGVTTFVDMYYFEDAIAEETKAAGMRGVLGESWLDFPVPDNKNEAQAAAYTEKDAAASGLFIDRGHELMEYFLHGRSA